MKKKLIFAITIGLFAVATVFNMNMLQSNDAGDVSLEGIAVMAQAGNEDLRQGIWIVVKSCSGSNSYITCSSGGTETCHLPDYCPRD